jgi:diadenosine tetraphosphatase ApaH/serine/threonine PP2A family protein phosphatase
MHRSPIAILSDIHSNFDALEAVCSDLDSVGVENVVCLGDLVGYAAYPDECIARVRERGWQTVLGNHDAALGKPWALEAMNDVAQAGMLWSEKSVSDDNRQWLASLPMRLAQTHTVFTHASLYEPGEWHYLIDVESALMHFLRQRIPLCFVGHTHRPMILAWQRETRLSAHVPGSGQLPLPTRGKVTLNVGSVGQPRDGDPRACYVLYFPKTHEVEFRRVDYDIKSAQHAIRRAGLPHFTAQRLAHGG